MCTPIYKEYYSHENADCYKIDLPWSIYDRDIRVLCKVSDGYDLARTIAIGIISERIQEVTKIAPEEPEEAHTQQPTQQAKNFCSNCGIKLL